MQSSSTYKILYLLCLLLLKNQTKNDILTEFQKIDISLNKPTINRYISILKKNGFEIEIKQIKNENVYCLVKDFKTLDFSEEELKAIYEAKQLVCLQRDYKRIRRMILLFYKFAKYIPDIETRKKFIDFGYFTKLDWGLVKTLEKHCQNKDIITIEYILPSGENRNITLHVDKIQIGGWSNRLYLYGIFEFGNQFSTLPIEKIYMVKKVNRQKTRFNLISDLLTYKISTNLLNSIELDEKEMIIEQNEDFTTIQRPKDDNFYIIQRLLNFCPDLYYISDSEIKKESKEKLEILKSTYDIKYDK